jgi:cytochrome bd-type quinol oxidase subunit 2
MKKIFASFFSLVIIVSTISSTAAQGLIDTNTAKDFASEVKTEAGFSSISIGDIVATVIKGALSLLAVVFIILIVLAGFKWMTAQGNEENVKQAQETLKTAIIGLIIVLAAYGITYFVFRYLPFGGTGGVQGGTGG